jgi:CubicO group peptidase (beta-lactamase class C family)
MRVLWLVVLSFTLFAGERDAPIKAAMREVIAAGEVPGAVTLIVRPNGNTHFAAHGKNFRRNSIFWIASMTKPVIAVSILMLAEEGKLSLDDRLSRFIPAFQDSPVTLRHMLTHTSGLPEATAEESARSLRLADLVPFIAARPLRFTPGERWQYCQSGINLLGRVVEVVSGLPLEDFLSRRIFEPLRMRDTTFYLQPKQLRRLVAPVRREANGFTPAANPVLYGKSPTSRDRYPAANGGLFSTASDYGRFARMLLRGGELDGRRYLSAASITALTRNETGERKAGFLPGHAWGLGVGIVVSPGGQTQRLAPGTFGHGGAFGTQCWISPAQGLAFILMVQRANFPNADDSVPRRAFTGAALP